MKKFFAVIALLIGLFCLLFLFVPTKWSFVFFEQQTNHAVAYLPLKEEETFVIRYVHSIHLSDVIETYKVTPDHTIQLSQLEYEDFAIGMPQNAGEGETFVEKDDGTYMITGMSKIYPSFDLLVGDVNRDLAFQYKGTEYDLKRVLTRGKAYTFKIVKLSLFDQWRGVTFNGK